MASNSTDGLDSPNHLFNFKLQIHNLPYSITFQFFNQSKASKFRSPNLKLVREVVEISETPSIEPSTPTSWESVNKQNSQLNEPKHFISQIQKSTNGAKSPIWQPSIAHFSSLTLIRRDTGYPIWQPESRIPQSYIKLMVPDKAKPQIQNDFDFYCYFLHQSNYRLVGEARTAFICHSRNRSFWCQRKMGYSGNGNRRLQTRLV